MLSHGMWTRAPTLKENVMKHFVYAAVVLFALTAVRGLEAGSFGESIELGDQNRTHGDYDLAVSHYSEALDAARNDTEKALALSKRALVQAFNLDNCREADKDARDALKLNRSGDIGHVGAYEAQAKCEMKDDNHKKASRLLEKAQKLDKVDFAMPNIHLMLGDCYRAMGEYEDALKTYAAVKDFSTATDGTIAVAHLNRGMTYQYNLKDNGAAKNEYDQALKLNKYLQKDVDVHFSNMR